MGFGNLGRAVTGALKQYPGAMSTAALNTGITGAAVGGLWGAGMGTLTGEGTFAGLARGAMQGGAIGGMAGAGWGAMTRGAPMRGGAPLQGAMDNLGRAWRGEGLRFGTDFTGVPGGVRGGLGAARFRGGPMQRRGLGVAGLRRNAPGQGIVPNTTAHPEGLRSNVTAQRLAELSKSKTMFKRRSMQEQAMNMGDFGAGVMG